MLLLDGWPAVQTNEEGPANTEAACMVTETTKVGSPSNPGKYWQDLMLLSSEAPALAPASLYQSPFVKTRNITKGAASRPGTHLTTSTRIQNSCLSPPEETASDLISTCDPDHILTAPTIPHGSNSVVSTSSPLLTSIAVDECAPVGPKLSEASVSKHSMNGVNGQLATLLTASGSLLNNRILTTNEHPSRMAQPHSVAGVLSTTKLTTRTDEEVVADLKRVRQRDNQPALKPTEPHVAREEDDDYVYNQDDEEDDAPGPLSQDKKISERKRKHLALLNQSLYESFGATETHDLPVGSQDDEDQSTKYLIDQSEKHNIISSPREYQIELFERAKEKNTIAVLDTGSGKTLIACLLLRHVIDQELEDRSKGKLSRVSFFLVDSVTLVYQQHSVMKANLNHESGFCYGGMKELSSKQLWDKRLEKNMIIVCTAEVLYQCLHHAFVTIEQINLLIFDEAHHAKKDHPYAKIIKDFYVQSNASVPLPKIFGMTASPVDSKTDVNRAAAELEGLLRSEIATTTDACLARHFSTKKLEEMALYEPLGMPAKTKLCEEMFQRFSTNKVFRKPLVYAEVAVKELGPWCADQVWLFCLTEEESKKLEAKTESKFHAQKFSEPLAVLEKRKAQFEEARAIIKAHHFEEPRFALSYVGASVNTNLSSKVNLLLKVLRDRYQRPTDDKCIVFVKQRYTARLLVDLCSRVAIGTSYLKVASLVGVKSPEAGDESKSIRQQVLTMTKFRRGEINCLIATSVAEEGLDIPDCNLVIRFDLYDTVIQYIQSRGRARHANSKYLHMVEKDNLQHYNLVAEVRKNEKILKELAMTLPEDRLLTGNDFSMEHFLAKERKQRVYNVPSTGAKLNYKMSLQVLSRFVTSLERDTESGQTQSAEFIMTSQSKLFVCEVIMPESSPIRGATGRPCSTKQVAKCSAAFETCLLLVQGKYIDDRLMPTFTKQLPAMRNAVLAVDSKKEAYDMRTKPSLWAAGEIGEKVYMTVLKHRTPESLERSPQPMAILTRKPMPDLPSFPLHFGNGKRSFVDCIPMFHPLDVNTESLDKIQAFTLSVFWDVFSKRYEAEVAAMPYFFVPIKSQETFGREASPSALIDWDVLEKVQKYNHINSLPEPWKHSLAQPDDFFRDRFIFDSYDGSRKFFSIGVTSKYKPMDPVPPNTAPRKGTRKDNSNIMEYSSSLWTKARARVTFLENQRVIEASLVSLRRNLLDEFDASEVEAPKKCFIIIEPLVVSALPVTVVAMAYTIPAIIHRLESYLIAIEACEMLHLDGIRPDLALEAVTKDSDNTEDHGNEQTNLQRGMGNNYERLEFIGDCFLKMATSISLYGIRPDHDEYRYHVDRMVLICNKNLYNSAITLKLHEYIRSSGFNRRAWYPEGLTLLKGKQALAPKTHRLGDKSIADVCEALIGAALVTHRDNKTSNGSYMDCAVRAVSEFVRSNNHNITTYADYYKLYKKPKYQLAVPTAAQLNLARQVEAVHNYHFKYPRLLRSAFCHPSYPYAYEHVPSYQRLEFLGDSLLDMACVNHLFHNNPDKDPQWLTEHKMAMVSNQFLGCVSVSLGFHRHMLSLDQQIMKRLTEYVTDITEARTQAEDEAVRNGKSREDFAPEFWTNIGQPPKCLPDLVEAYIGAIFVDSEYDFSEVERFFDAHISPYFKDMTVYDTYANKHPTTALGHFLHHNMGCGDWAVPSDEKPGKDGRKTAIFCAVIIHDQVVCTSSAESIRYAKLGVAKKAIRTLEGMGLQEFKAKYGCHCNLEIENEDAARAIEIAVDAAGMPTAVDASGKLLGVAGAILTKENIPTPVMK